MSSELARRDKTVDRSLRYLEDFCGLADRAGLGTGPPSDKRSRRNRDLPPLRGAANHVSAPPLTSAAASASLDFAQAIDLLSAPFSRHALEKCAIHLPVEPNRPQSVPRLGSRQDRSALQAGVFCGRTKRRGKPHACPPSLRTISRPFGSATRSHRPRAVRGSPAGLRAHCPRSGRSRLRYVA